MNRSIWMAFVLILLVASLASAQGNLPAKPVELTDLATVSAVAPDLVVTQFRATRPAANTFAFLSGVKRSPGYAFVPVEFTVTNTGNTNAPEFQIVPMCRLQEKVVRRAGFLGYKGSQDMVGGGGAGFSAVGVDVGSPGAALRVPSPLPPGGSVTATSTVAVPVGTARGRVALWIVVDEMNEVAESNEANNESANAIVLVR